MTPRKWLGAAVLALTASSASLAGDTPAWLERIDFKGDFRLRYEGFDQDGSFDNGHRDRLRFRLRFGFESRIREDLRVGFALHSGDPADPVSANQTLDEGLSFKEINIGEAWVDWTAADWGSVRLGKFLPDDLWHVSDLQWDDDVAIEGAMESFHFGGSGGFAGVTANVYQVVLNESGDGSDAYLFGAQVRPAFRVGEKSELTVGVGYDSYSHPEDVVALSLDGDLGGNPITNIVIDPDGNLASDFRIVQAFAEWSNKASERWPFKVSVFAYRNTGADGLGEDQDSALFARVQVGDYKKFKQMAIRLTRYESEPDALFYAYAQSDTGLGSNVEGYRFDYRLGMPARSYINISWYNVEPKVGPGETTDRWQLDYVFRM